MNVKRAKTAGFCFGVKRAVETVYEQAKNSDAAPIYTYGPIIHNEEVVKDLENQGVIVLRTEQELEQLTEGTVIIRSHGVAKYIYEKLEKKKIQIVDATCPFVKKIHRIVNRESAAGGRNPRLGRRTGFCGGNKRRCRFPCIGSGKSRMCCRPNDI